MATVKQYVTQAWEIQKAIALKMGVDVRGEPKGVRVMLQSTLVIICVLVKLLVDKGVFTNAEVTAAFDFVRDDDYPDEPLYPPVIL